VRSRAEALQQSAQKLYSFENPFDARNGASSDESVVSVTPDRDAPQSTTEIRVKQMAKPDSFLSQSISRGTEIPSGTYGFQVGEQEGTFDFEGGDLQDFAQAINTELGDLVQARVVNDTANTVVLRLESQKPGKANTLRFLEDSRAIAEELGIIRSTADTSRDLSLQPAQLAGWEAPLDSQAVQVTDGTLTVKPEGRVSIPVSPTLQVTDNMVLELEVNVIDRSDEAQSPPPPPPGPQLPEPGGVTLDGVTVQNAPSDTVLPERDPPEPPEIIRNDQFLFARSGGQDVPLPKLENTADFQTVTVQLREYVDSISALRVQNKNTFRDIQVRNARIYDPEARGDYKPLNPVSTAQDAKLVVDGVPVTRSSNTIDDLIEDATITVQGESTRPVTVRVKPDIETAKNSVIEFIGNYNQLIRDINILTRTNEQIVEEISYFDQEQTEDAKEKLGLFQGEMVLSQLQSRLQTIMMNPHPTGPQGYRLLAEIGISTNASGVNTGNVRRSRLRGYLEIDEEKLDAALKKDFSSVAKLFGSDRNQDQVPDSGAAVEVYQYVKPYNETGGILATRRQTLDSRISRTQEDIREFEDHLSDYKQDLQTDFGRMKEAMQDLDRQQNALQRLNSGGGG
jgi:flagellar hook-associated protein 2